MRLTTIILFIAIVQVSASTYAQKITLSEKNASLIKVFDQISLQSGFDFFVSKALLKNANPVNIKVRNADLEIVLKQIFENQPLEFSIQDKSVVVKEREPSFLDKVIATFNAIDVHGRVLDEEGKPLAGATISIVRVESKGAEAGKAGDFSLSYKGRNAAAITDSNGEFTLKNVDESSTIIVSYTGYTVYRAKVTKEMGAIKMALDGNLQEVNVRVNTGYQSIARERSAGSIAKPDMNILKSRSGSMNVIQRLDGLVPGLTINNAPNTTGATILVRGLTSINGSKNPLYVVNGIPMDDITSLNPNDVEDVTVLKDATAASIWGARAANGVVVIITKKGKHSSDVKVDYDAFINFQGKPDLGYMPVLRGADFIRSARDLFDPVLFPWATVSKPISGTAVIAPHELILYNQNSGLITKDQADAQLSVLAGQDNLQEIKDLWYRNSSLMNHTISLSGGGSKYSFYGSSAYTSTKNNLPGDIDDNYGLNLRQDYKFNDRFQVYLIADLRNNTIGSKQMATLNSGSTNNQTASPNAYFLPYVSFKNADGTNASMPWLYRPDDARAIYEKQSLISLDYNPLNEVDKGSTKTNFIYGRLTSGLTVKLVKGLRFEGVYGFTKSANKQTNLLDEDNFLVRNELVAFTVAPKTVGGLPTYYLPSSGGRNTIRNKNQRDWTVRNQLIYDEAWGEGKHQLTVLAGQEAQESFLNMNSTVVRGYNSQLLSYGLIDYNLLSKNTTLSNSAPSAGSTTVYYGIPVYANNLSSSILSPDQFTESELTTRFTSYYANGGYTYDRKYTLNGSWRIDKSNLFGKDKSAQNKPVWSAGASWAIGKESFMEHLNWIDRLVLRTTYGISGNSPDPGSAASFDVLSRVSNVFFPNPNGVQITTPGNKKLSWETTKTTNIGLDFSVLSNRISGSVDLYNKNTENLIGFSPVNPFTGYANITGNLGSMNNKGVELSLVTVNIQQKDFRWSSLFNFAHNKNTITKLNTLKTLNGVSSPLSSAEDFVNQPYLEGYSAFSIFAYPFVGLDNLGDPQIKLKDGTIAKKPGVAKVEDLKYMGTYQPVWSGGFTNVLQYKEFSLSLNAVYNLGHVMRRDVNSTYSNVRLIPSSGSSAFTTGNINNEFVDRWKKAGDEAFTNVPSVVTGASASRRNTSYYTMSDMNVLDASYIKLRDVTLSYGLPKILLSKLKIVDLTLRAQVSNILLWTANKANIDPEFHNALGGQVAGGSRITPFNQNTVTFGLHLTL